MDTQIASLEADGAKKNKGHIEALIQERRVHVDRLKEQFDKQASMLDGKDAASDAIESGRERKAASKSSTGSSSASGRAHARIDQLNPPSLAGAVTQGAEGAAAAVGEKSNGAALRSAEEELEVMSLVRDLEVRREECVRTRV